MAIPSEIFRKPMMRTFARRTGWLAPFLCLIALAGCGGDGTQPAFDTLHPVSGVVETAEGQPVTGGVVRFDAEPRDDNFLINSEISPDGSFTLSTVRTTDTRGERRTGVPAGTYRVTYLPFVADQTLSNQGPVTLPEPMVVPVSESRLELKLP
jgi:hypothetical protein